MPRLHLPQTHTDADLALAGQISGLMGSGELFVTWTYHGGPGAAPSVPAELRLPPHPAVEVAALLAQCAAGVWRALTGTPGSGAGSDAGRKPSSGPEPAPGRTS